MPTTDDDRSTTERAADVHDRVANLDLDAPLTTQVGYAESADHVPNPYFQSASLDTSDTSGVVHGIKEITPVFEIARQQNLRTAARALDPEDDSVPSELVTLPQGQVSVMGTTKTAEEGINDVLRAVEANQDRPIELGGLTPAQVEAARGVEPASYEADEVPERPDVEGVRDAEDLASGKVGVEELTGTPAADPAPGETTGSTSKVGSSSTTSSTRAASSTSKSSAAKNDK